MISVGDGDQGARRTYWDTSKTADGILIRVLGGISKQDICLSEFLVSNIGIAVVGSHDGSWAFALAPSQKNITLSRSVIQVTAGQRIWEILAMRGVSYRAWYRGRT